MVGLEINGFSAGVHRRQKMITVLNVYLSLCMLKYNMNTEKQENSAHFFTIFNNHPWKFEVC